MARTVDDAELMARVQGGDEDALAILVRRYAAPLLSFLTRVLADRHAAEDTFQDVWVLVWVKRSSFDATRRFRPWLYRIATNRCASQRRRGRLRIAHGGIDDCPVAFETDDGELPSLRREALDAASAAIQRLPDAQREVVTLRLYASLSYAEIARVLRVEETTARSNMSYALRTLRRRLANWIETSPSEETCDDHARARGRHPRPDR